MKHAVFYLDKAALRKKESQVPIPPHEQQASWNTFSYKGGTSLSHIIATISYSGCWLPTSVNMSGTRPFKYKFCLNVRNSLPLNYIMLELETWLKPVFQGKFNTFFGYYACVCVVYKCVHVSAYVHMCVYVCGEHIYMPLHVKATGQHEVSSSENIQLFTH